ncbi:hypothetical protein FKM82_005413 [Ascaphus truei]
MIPARAGDRAKTSVSGSWGPGTTLLHQGKAVDGPHPYTLVLPQKPHKTLVIKLTKHEKKNGLCVRSETSFHFVTLTSCSFWQT